MRFELRKTPPWALAGLIVLCLGGCSSDPYPRVDSQAPTSTSTSTSMPTPSASPATESSPDYSAGMSGFERQLPRAGHFVTQWAETAGSVEIVRHSDGTAWATLTNFSTGASQNSRIYLNEGELVRNADGAWTTDGGESFEISPVSESASTQEIEIQGSSQLDSAR